MQCLRPPEKSLPDIWKKARLPRAAALLLALLTASCCGLSFQVQDGDGANSQYQRVFPVSGSTVNMTTYSAWPSAVPGSTARKFSGGVFDGNLVWLIPSNAAAVVTVNIGNNGGGGGTMTSYSTWPTGVTTTDLSIGNNAFEGGVFDGRYVWMTPSSSKYIVRIDTASASRGAMISVSLPSGTGSVGNVAFMGCGFDGKYMWLIPRKATTLVYVDTTQATPSAVTFTGAWPSSPFSLSSSGSFAGAAFDGVKYLWLAPHWTNAVVRVDVKNFANAMVSYNGYPTGLTNVASGAFFGVVYDGIRYLYLIPFFANGVVQFDTSSGGMGSMKMFNTWPSGLTNVANIMFAGGTFDGRFVWMANQNSNMVVRLDTKANGAMVGFSPAITGSPSFLGGLFDGRCVVLVPYSQASLLRICRNSTSTLFSASHSVTKSRSNDNKGSASVSSSQEQSSSRSRSKKSKSHTVGTSQRSASATLSGGPRSMTASESATKSHTRRSSSPSDTLSRSGMKATSSASSSQQRSFTISRSRKSHTHSGGTAAHSETMSQSARPHSWSVSNTVTRTHTGQSWTFSPSRLITETISRTRRSRTHSQATLPKSESASLTGKQNTHSGSITASKTRSPPSFSQSGMRLTSSISSSAQRSATISRTRKSHTLSQATAPHTQSLSESGPSLSASRSAERRSLSPSGSLLRSSTKTHFSRTRSGRSAPRTLSASGSVAEPSTTRSWTSSMTLTIGTRTRSITESDLSSSREESKTLCSNTPSLSSSQGTAMRSLSETPSKGTITSSIRWVRTRSRGYDMSPSPTSSGTPNRHLSLSSSDSHRQTATSSADSHQRSASTSITAMHASRTWSASASLSYSKASLSAEIHSRSKSSSLNGSSMTEERSREATSSRTEASSSRSDSPGGLSGTSTASSTVQVIPPTSTRSRPSVSISESAASNTSAFTRSSASTTISGSVRRGHRRLLVVMSTTSSMSDAATRSFTKGSMLKTMSSSGQVSARQHRHSKWSMSLSMTSTIQWSASRCAALVVSTKPSPLTGPILAEARNSNGSSSSSATVYIKITNGRWTRTDNVTTATSFVSFSSPLFDGKLCACAVWTPWLMECSLPVVPSLRSMVESSMITVLVKRAGIVDACSSNGGLMSSSSLSYLLLVGPGAQLASLATAVETTGTAVAAAATVSAVAGLGAASSAQALAVLGMTSCASPGAQKQTSSLRYLLSPFVDLGYVAMVLGNVGIVLGVAMLQGTAIGLEVFVARRSLIRACGDVRFPSFALAIAALLFQGTVFAGLVLVTTQGSATSQVSLGAAALLFCALLPMWSTWYVQRYVVQKLVFVLYTHSLPGAAVPQSWMFRLLVPDGFWDSVDAVGNEMEVGRRFGKVVNSFRDQRSVLLHAYPQVSAYLFNTAAVVLASHGLCEVMYAALGLMSCASCGFVCWTRPHRTPFLNVLSGCSFAVLGLVCAVQWAEYANVSNPNLPLVTASINILQLAVIVVRSVYDMALFFLHRKWFAMLPKPNHHHFTDAAVGEASAEELVTLNREMAMLETMHKTRSFLSSSTSSSRSSSSSSSLSSVELQEIRSGILRSHPLPNREERSTVMSGSFNDSFILASVRGGVGGGGGGEARSVSRGTFDSFSGDDVSSRSLHSPPPPRAAAAVRSPMSDRQVPAPRLSRVDLDDL